MGHSVAAAFQLTDRFMANSRTPDYITVPYDHLNKLHKEGFIKLLLEQGKAHGHDISPYHAAVVSQMDGREFKTILVCESQSANAKVEGMATITPAASAEGPISFLEDIVVTEGSRRKGLGTHLIDRCLIDSWNNGYKGFAWETGSQNKSAAFLYLKIDPAFDADKLHNVWEFSAESVRELSLREGRRSPLATTSDLGLIANTLGDQPDKDLGYLSEQLQKQTTNGKAVNGHDSDARRAPSFIVVSKDNYPPTGGAPNAGSFAVVSEGFSTFQGRIRADVRLYLSPNFSQRNVLEIVKGVSSEITKRQRWQGSPMHVEFSNAVFDLDQRAAYAEAKRIFPAVEILHEYGGRTLTHGDDNMVAYGLYGQRYFAAITRAIKSLPEHSPSKDKAIIRLKKESKKYGSGPHLV